MARWRSGTVLASAIPVTLVVLVGLVAGCAPLVGVAYPESAAPPAGEAPVPPEFEVVPGEGLPGRLGRLDAVAVGEAGVVAVGEIETVDALAGEALIMFSADGRTWERVGPGPGLSLTDVAAGPDGFVAVGSRGGDSDQDLAAILVSADGRSWDLLPPDAHPEAEAYLEWVEAGPGAYRAGGSLTGDQGGAVSWWSTDLRTWHEDGAAVTWAVPAGDGWLESRDRMVRVAAFVPGGSEVPWSPVEEPQGDPTIIQLGPAAAAGSTALLVSGAAGAPCGVLGGGGSCAAEQGFWASTDGTTWRLLPAGSPGAPPPYVVALGTGGDGELLALGYGTLRISLDGWHWAIVAEPSAGVAYNDVAPFRDGYVVVGTTTPAAGDPAPVSHLLIPVERP